MLQFEKCYEYYKVGIFGIFYYFFYIKRHIVNLYQSIEIIKKKKKNEIIGIFFLWRFSKVG